MIQTHILHFPGKHPNYQALHPCLWNYVNVQLRILSKKESKQEGIWL